MNLAQKHQAYSKRVKVLAFIFDVRRKPFELWQKTERLHEGTIQQSFFRGCKDVRREGVETTRTVKEILNQLKLVGREQVDEAVLCCDVEQTLRSRIEMILHSIVITYYFL